MRAGLAISDIASEIVPDASIQHVGMYRDEETLEPVWYYDKTPIKYENPEKIKVFILDPMLATGNSALAAINLFLKSIHMMAKPKSPSRPTVRLIPLWRVSKMLNAMS